VSRRSPRERRERAAARREADASAPAPERPRMSLALQLGILAAVFLGTTLIAELAGAANLGVALGVGQIAFAIAAVWLIVWR
jgi:hypothetical protein